MFEYNVGVSCGHKVLLVVFPVCLGWLGYQVLQLHDCCFPIDRRFPFKEPFPWFQFFHKIWRECRDPWREALAMSGFSRYICLNHFVDILLKFFTHCVDVCMANNLERVVFKKFIHSIVVSVSKTPEWLEYGFRFGYWAFDWKTDSIVIRAVVCPGQGLILFGKEKTVAIEGHDKGVIWTGRKVNGFLKIASSKISMSSFSSSLELHAVFQFTSGKFRSPQIRAGFDFRMVLRSFWKSLILYRYALPFGGL